MTEGVRQDVEAAIVESLRSAREPVREAVLFERVRRRVVVGEAEFIAIAEHLATAGRVRVSVEHDLPAHDLPPFQARFYALIA